MQLRAAMSDNVESKLVTAPRLLELLFDATGRPSLRWLREQQARRTIPFIKIRRRIFFDVAQVRLALQEHFTISRPNRVLNKTPRRKASEPCSPSPVLQTPT
jgi:hypothetical protein